MTRLTLGCLAVASLLLLSPDSASAGPIRHRQARQHARIVQGERSGALAPGESRLLRHEQRAIDRARARSLADGQMSRREARRLTRAQNRAGRDIYGLKHNGRVAGSER